MDISPSILVTGGAGYIGSVITGLLLSKNAKVKVIDTLWFDKRVPLIFQNNPDYEFIYGDIRNIDLLNKVLTEVDYVIHTAAVVGEPASNKFPELTKSVNEEASINLINCCREKKIKGIIFFSTCSNYGTTQSIADEQSPVKPLSLYAQTKVNVENYLINNVKDLNWVIGRLSTVYGSSPRMRFDLTVNDFTLNAFSKKCLEIFFPLSFRPYIHVFDLAQVMHQIILNFNKVKNNVFNIGFPGENYQKIEIANSIKKIIPELKIEILKEGGDLRDYQVNFDKLKSFINPIQRYNVDKSVNEILSVLKYSLIQDPYHPMYFNTSINWHEELKTA